MTVLTWSEDRVEQLKKLWEAGLSASQIAAELGNVTRNAVIGKVHRLGLSGRAKSPSSAAPRQRKARPAQHMMRVSRPVSRGNTALAHAFEVEMEPDPIAFDNVVPMSQRLSLLELNEATCHWPVGDPSSPEFFFCGGKALCGLPYCAHHSRVAYQPAADRRRAAAEADAVRRGLVARMESTGRANARAMTGSAKSGTVSRLAGIPRVALRFTRATRSPTSSPSCAVIASAATQTTLALRSMDCFASLAMTIVVCRAFAGTTASAREAPTAPPSQTGHPAHSRRRARCGSGPARGRG